MQPLKNMISLQIKKTQLDQLMPLIREELSLGRSVRFSPSGSSMLPMLREGVDSVVLSPLPEKLEKYDLPLYRRDSGQYILHRVIQVGETYTCIGDNQFNKETGLQHEQMIAIVTSFYRKNKEICTNNFLYRLYCYVWHYSRPIRYFCKRGIRWLWRHLK